MKSNRYQGLSLELRRALLIISSLFLAGALLGYVFLGLLAGVSIYALILFVETRRFYFWLDGKTKDLPNHNHVLIDVAEAIHLMRSQHKKTKLRLKSQLRRVEQSTSALHDGVLVLRHFDRLAWWNEAAGKLLSLNPKTDSGQAITNFVRDPKFVAYLENSNFSTPLTLKRSGHEGQWIQFEVTNYGKEERLMVIRDVSKLLQLEQMRKDFVSNVSHELRTPLTVVSGYVENLEMFSDTLPEAVTHSLQHISAQVGRMNEMVEDLSLLSRLDESDSLISTTEVDLRQLVESLVAQMELLKRPEHEIIVELCDEVKVLGSQRELYSAFSNIAFNALKYSPAGGEIVVRLRDRGDKVSFSVKDSGIGIDPKHIPRLTERFYRADSARASVISGTGLGLAITKHVLIRHGGELRIQSWPGKGSKFKCTFPKYDG